MKDVQRRTIVSELSRALKNGQAPSPEDLGSMVGAWLSHVRDEDLAAIDRSALTELLQGQLELGTVRRGDEDLVRVVPPTTGRSRALVEVVTDDRPFVVDTIAMALTGAGWTVEELLHPQFLCERDEHGRLTRASLSEDGSRGESWVGVLAQPPAGTEPTEASRQLEVDLAQGLRDLAAAVDDFSAMRERMVTISTELDSRPGPAGQNERRTAAELLQYLTDDRFTFLGFREYDYVDGAAVAREDTGLGILRGRPAEDEFHAMPTQEPVLLLALTKDSRHSKVHRPVLMDYLAVRRFDEAGTVVGEQRFLGLLGQRAYTDGVRSIPVVRDKIAAVIRRLGYGEDGHGARAIWAVADALPREELLHATSDELLPALRDISQLKERRRVRLFVRRSPWPGRMTALVYLPRDRYDTAVRLRIQRALVRATGATSIDHEAHVTQSVLARLHFTLGLPADQEVEVDVPALERDLVEATRNWDDDLHELAQGLGSQERGVRFPDAYKEDCTPRQALADLLALNRIETPDGMEFAVYAPDHPQDPSDLHLKVMRVGSDMQLQQVMPHLTSLGVEVLDEKPYGLTLRGRQAMVYDFGLRVPGGAEAWGTADRERLTSAFRASWRGRTEVDDFNTLVGEGGMTWRQVQVLRAVSRYLRQLGSSYSQAHVARTLRQNQPVARHLVQLFECRFDPDLEGDRQEQVDAVLAELAEELDAVASLDQDRILRQFQEVLVAMVRTNAFAEDCPALAFKVLPRELSLAPQPRPAFEVFVHSPRVEGVHLRYGAVARGGLRWSDRPEDFRTEVLGLVKAQMVKNTVIVPVGAKGGFYPRQLPNPADDRSAWLEEGKACYRLFISSLLSITDNIVDGGVVPPPRVVCHDVDDPYLVVAADKGTASFSDLANEIAVDRGFWLGDAFASGGSVGYDHKAMGITARGAWESVKHHFHELGTDCQQEDFTCVGIGDMAGDVFGNGMLLSRHTRLVAAFNHMHVFLDPDPDPESSFEERRRLFELPRSTWADYDESLISAGGGVHSRQAKSIPVTPQVRKALDIPEGVERMTPTEMIRAILAAPVDLLWNGGIGTYVKGSGESHAEVGDKANDAVRLNGSEVRAKVAGEGGNLGWTQLGRIEFARGGGHINTDFIDNSAGVDTSDHEVNIKVLLDAEVNAGRLDKAERDAMLPRMTDDVARLVLAHNVDQNLALANARLNAAAMAGVHEDWMVELEQAGYLDRAVENMPSSAEMRSRIAGGTGLTGPELATLLAWSKIWLADQVLDSDLPEDPYLADRLVKYFPPLLRETLGERMPQHRLHREIITTVAVNRFVNSQGMTACHRLSQETGASASQVVRAQLAARSIFEAGRTEVDTRRSALDAALQTDMRVRVRTLVENGARWLLHSRPDGIDVRAMVDRYHGGVQELLGMLPELLGSAARESYDEQLRVVTELGVDEPLAALAVGSAWAHLLPACVEIAVQRGIDSPTVARILFATTERLGLDRMLDRVEALPRTNRWDTMARSAIRDDLLSVQAELADQVVAHAEGQAVDEALESWWQATPGAEGRQGLLQEILDGGTDLARMSVALRTVRGFMAKA